MRILVSLVAIAAFTATAYAQQATQPSTHGHRTMAHRFEQANTTHDGHLTLEQAKAGYKSVAQHFSAIDRDKKGYVTEEDVRAYFKEQRALHHQSTPDHQQPS
jgi:hypothetical protein